MRPHTFARVQRGISMIEILVTLLVISFAMLGAVGLQMQSMRMNAAGQFRSQAVFFAGDLAERMEANKDAAIAGNYVTLETSTPVVASKNCISSTCSGLELADSDLQEWGTAIQAALPGASWSVSTSDVAGTNPSTFTIVVKWVDRVANTTYQTASATESFSYTATRTVQSP
jgi:type IV pilus assembly protein PilV